MLLFLIEPNFYLKIELVWRMEEIYLDILATVYKGIHIKKQNNGLPTY